MKPAATNPRLIVFDFDGTIADTLGDVRRIYNQLAPDYGWRQVLPDELDTLRRCSLTELLAELGIPKYRVPSLVTRGTRLLRECIDQVAPVPGIGEALTTLRTRVDHLGILTSNSEDNVQRFLHNHQLGGLFDFISAKSKLSGKARHLNAIRTTFSLQREAMLFVGDELRDIKAAQKARIPVAAVTWGFNSRDALAATHPDHLIDHPAQLPPLVASTPLP